MSAASDSILDRADEVRQPQQNQEWIREIRGDDTILKTIAGGSEIVTELRRHGAPIDGRLIHVFNMDRFDETEETFPEDSVADALNKVRQYIEEHPLPKSPAESYGDKPDLTEKMQRLGKTIDSPRPSTLRESAVDPSIQE